MKRKILCAIAALALCAGIGYGARQPILRRVYSDLPDKVQTKDYCVVERDTETGVDYFKFYDKNGNLISVIRRDDAKGNPFVTSALTSK